MAHSDDARLKLRTDRIVWRAVEEEVMILDTTTSHYLSVNKTGTALWPLLVDGCSRTQLVDTLVESFAVDAETARTDVESFVGMLDGLGLLESAAG